MAVLPWILPGLAWPYLLPGPVPLGTGCVLLAAALWLVILRRLRDSYPCEGKWGQGPLLFLLAAAGLCFTVERGLELRLERPVAPVVVTGRVTSLPERQGDLLRFRFRAESGPWGASPRRLEVRWFEPEASPRVGERWRLGLRLAPPRGRVNFAGSDRERYWFSERVHGLGTVSGAVHRRLDAARGHPVQRVRAGLRERLLGHLEGLPGTGLVLALGLGERSALSKPLRAALRGTGTGHLLAISGLHVGLVGGFGFVIGRLLFSLSPWRGRRWPAVHAAACAGLLCAAGYALLAGFGTSPRRALVMLAVGVFALMRRHHVGPWRGLLLAAVAVLVLDPLAPLAAGFWLSFGAVAILLHQFSGRAPPSAGFAALLRAQAGIGLALAPLGMAWFQAVSPGAYPSNLLAIPYVSFILLPLVLIAVAATGLSLPGHGFLATLAAEAARRLEQGLLWADSGLRQLTWTTAQPTDGALVLGLLGGFLCLLPRGLRLRRFGALLLLPLLLPPDPDLPEGAFRLTFLDVGQGQATLVETRRHLLLVDTGPGWPGTWNLADSVLAPAVAQAGRNRPDLLLISHGDLDHAGGLEALRHTWPGVSLTGSLPRHHQDVPPCHDRQAWAWDGVAFRVRHPSPFLPYRGNDSSCVLELRGPGGAALLPGDIGRLVEARLARTSPPADGYRILAAPHHGSDSSSGAAFVAWAAPKHVVFSAAYGNRFGFPRARVLSRYLEGTSRLAGTAECGALRYRVDPGGQVSAIAARQARRGFWRFPAASHCPGAHGVPPLTPPEAFRYHAGHTENNSAPKE